MFNRGDSFTLEELQQQTQLPENVLKTAISQLAAVSSGPLLNTDTSFTHISLNETPQFSSPVIRLFTLPHLEAPNQSQASMAKEDQSLHKLQLEAGIARILKKIKFIKVSELAGKVNSMLSFRVDVGEKSVLN